MNLPPTPQPNRMAQIWLGFPDVATLRKQHRNPDDENGRDKE